MRRELADFPGIFLDVEKTRWIEIESTDGVLVWLPRVLAVTDVPNRARVIENLRGRYAGWWDSTGAKGSPYQVATLNVRGWGARLTRGIGPILDATLWIVFDDKEQALERAKQIVMPTNWYQDCEPKMPPYRLRGEPKPKRAV